jgi:phosphatidylinositol alpha-1,6-mannosyltransferase
MNRPTLVLSEIFPPAHGGSGRFLWEIYRRLPREEYLFVVGQHPDAEAFDATHNREFLRQPLAMRTRGIRSWANIKTYFGTARRLAKQIKKRQVRAVHASRNLHEGFTAYLIRKLTGTPYLLYCHGEDIGVSKTSRELAWMTRRVLGSAAGIIANSQNTLSLLARDWGVPESKIRVVYPGMDARLFAPAAISTSTRERLGWQNRTVLLTVGRLQLRKGHDMLLQALPAIRERVPHLLYAIVGTGEEEPRLRNLVQELGIEDAVQFMGAVSDQEMVHCYQQCDLFILPNRTVQGDIEGFGMVLLEAQACGKPVIAGDSGGTRETMKIPDTGVILDCTQTEPLARGVIELLTDPARLQAMGERGPSWVQQFDWPNVARSASEAFEQLLPPR